jgi:diguanylate cyclase (GGDEF)-like protein
VTLRARLTAAFLAVVLGPVLVGAIFVGATVGEVSRQRSEERLDLAITGVRTALDALCTRISSAARAAALASRGGRDISAARQVAQTVTEGIQLVAGDGRVLLAAGSMPSKPWADCSGANTAAPPPTGYAAILARVEMRDPDGRLLGYAYAVHPVDRALVHELSAAAGAAVTVLPAGPGSNLSTEHGPDLREVAAIAGNLRGETTGETEGGRFVRRCDPMEGEPLPLALSVARDDPQGLYAVLIAVVVAAGLLAAAAAWWLARSTARPITELAYAVERVAAGDLSARVPVRSRDEVGRLAATFNRMTREMQGYVQALTASRDQLRGHLGLLGDTLSSTHDLDRILRVILQTALAGTGARAGVVLLLDPPSGMLLGRCAEGESADGHPIIVSDLRVRLGEGLLGTVAASGDARRGRVDRDGPPIAPYEPLCHTYVAVPFAAPDPGTTGPTAGLGPSGSPVDPDAVPVAADGEVLPVARGVLALYDRHGFDEFDDADLQTLRTFAGQAAVALDNVRVHKEAERLSLTDPLTGLSNYRYLKESLRREVERASRFDHTLAVLALDLDRFKDVNDTYGPAAGDAVLAEFARRVRAEIREVDFAFRQGGEEFVVLLPETDAAGGAVVAERLGEAIRRSPVVVSSGPEQQRVDVTVSIGVAVYPEHGSIGTAVLEAADDALYAAKAAGRDTYRVARKGSDPVPALGGGGPSGAPNGTHPPRQSRGG